MNAALGQILQQLIGSFVGDQAPQKNPAYGLEPGDVDPSFKGDPSQLVQQPYVTPSWGTRFFHPDVASQETQKNLEGYNALIDNAIKQTVGASNVNLVKPFAGQQFGQISNPRAASVLYPNLSAEGIESGNRAAADVSNNLPALGSMGALARAQDVIRSGAARLSSGSPEKEVAASNATSDYTAKVLPSELDYKLGRNAADLSLLPSEVFARGFSNVAAGQDARRSVEGGDKLDSLFKSSLNTKLNEGSVSEALSKEKAGQIPLMTAMQGQDRYNTMWNLMHPEVPNVPFFRDPATGHAIRNPAYVNMMDMMNAKLAGGNASSKSIPLPSSGLHIIPDASSNAPATAPLTVPVGNTKSKLTSHDNIPQLQTAKSKIPEGLTYDEQVAWLAKHPESVNKMDLSKILPAIGKLFRNGYDKYGNYDPYGTNNYTKNMQQ